MKLTPKVLEALEDLCNDDTLEISIDLMERSLDLALVGDFWEDDHEARDFAMAYRRLSKQFSRIREALNEQ